MRWAATTGAAMPGLDCDPGNHPPLQVPLFQETRLARYPCRHGSHLSVDRTRFRRRAPGLDAARGRGGHEPLCPAVRPARAAVRHALQTLARQHPGAGLPAGLCQRLADHLWDRCTGRLHRAADLAARQRLLRHGAVDVQQQLYRLSASGAVAGRLGSDRGGHGHSDRGADHPAADPDPDRVPSRARTRQHAADAGAGAAHGRYQSDPAGDRGRTGVLGARLAPAGGDRAHHRAAGRLGGGGGAVCHRRQSGRTAGAGRARPGDGDRHRQAGGPSARGLRDADAGADARSDARSGRPDSGGTADGDDLPADRPAL